MIKKIIVKSALIVMIVCASLFCVTFNNVREVNAQEIGELVTVEDTTNTNEFLKGEVQGYGDYPVGSTVTLTATPVDGCHFVSWKDTEGNVVSTNNPYSFVIDKNTQVRAEFDFTAFSVTDNFSSFMIGSLSYEYDTERFDESNILNYARATVEDNNIVGKFYYNDIVTLNYVLSNSGSFVKEFESSNFVINKPVVLISVDSSGKILWTETGGVKDLELKDTIFSEIPSVYYDCNVNDYVIVTNSSVGGKYVATGVQIRTKIVKDLIIRVTQNKLKLITMEAMLREDNSMPVTEMAKLDIALVEDTIDFEYGYYGKIEDYTIITNLHEETIDEEKKYYQYYLVEPNANYKIILSDNFGYVYKQTNSSMDRIIKGYFDNSISGFTFIYEKRGYKINFEQLVKTDSGIVTVDTNWANLSSVNGHAGDTIKVEFKDEQFLIYKNESVVPNLTFGILDNVFGYKFYGFSLTNALTEGNTSITYIISEDNPAGTTIFVILEKLEYNLFFGATDKTGEYSEYLTSRVTNLPQNRTIKRLDQINLTADLPDGFKESGWILKQDGKVIDLAKTNFTFVPNSNNETVEVLLKVDYEYFDFNYQLDGYDSTEQQNVAFIQLNVVEYFVLNEEKDVLTVHGKYYNHNTNGVWEQNLTKSTIQTEEHSINFSSSYLDVKVYLTQEEDLDYLIFNGKKYLYDSDEEKFRIYKQGIREEIELKSTNTNDENGVVYKLGLTNVCVDDFIFMSSKVLDEFDNDYLFKYFTKKGTNQTLGYKKYTEENKPSVYFLIDRFNRATTIIVKYMLKSGTIIVKSNNEEAFSIAQLKTLYMSGSEVYNDNYKYWAFSLDYNQSFTIKIPITTITEGYRFTSFETKFEDETTSLINNYDTDEEFYSYVISYDSSYLNSVITLNFEEIVYKVFVEGNTSVEVTNNQNENLMYVYNDGDNNKNVFNLTWTAIQNQAQISIVSTNGFYVSKAYFGKEANIFSELIGNNSKETRVTYIFTADEFRNIISYTNNNETTLKLEEERRLFKITIQYVEPNNIYGEYFKTALTSCSQFDKSGEEYVLKKSEQSQASAKIGQTGTIFMLEFKNIEYETWITLEIDDANLKGMYFSSWTYNGRILTSEEYFQLKEDMFIYANFNAIDYQISFKYLNESLLPSNDIRNCASLKVDGLDSSYLNIGNTIELKFIEKTGYQLIDVFYQNVESVSIFERLNNNSTYFTYIDNEFVPNNYLSSTRDEQKESSTNRIIEIFLVFKEKLYSITTIIESTSKQNTTGVEVKDWIELMEIKYLDNNEYKSKEANESGVVVYRTNTSLQVRFKSSISGVVLKSLKLGNNTINSKNAETDIAGQTVELFVDDENCYVLRFILNSELLESVGTETFFNVILRYEINKYLITFTANSLNNKDLVSTFGLHLSWTYKNGNNSGGSSVTGTNLSNAKYYSSSTLFYGMESSWTIKYNPEEQANPSNYDKDFDKKYEFVYFVYGDYKFVPKEEDCSVNTYTLYLNKFYVDTYGNEFMLWELIGAETRPTIKAVYNPLVSYGKNMIYTDGSYIKTVDYNGYNQPLTSSADNIAEPDIIYDDDEFGQINISYFVEQGLNVDPKDANTYRISFVFVKDGKIIDNWELLDKIYLVINKVRLQVDHIGEITKEYDGTNSFTADNIYELKKQQNSAEINSTGFYIVGLKGSDAGTLDLDAISGYYTDYNVGKGIDVKINNIKLSAALAINYYLVEEAGQTFELILKGKGTIKQKALTINLNTYTFYNIVYKEDVEDLTSALKYVKNSELEFNEELAGSDECYIDESLLVFTLNEYSIGYGRTITVKLSASLNGANKANYYINDIIYTIDIYPYEIIYEISDVGKFTITDYDELCVIPIETKLDGLTVEIISNGHQEYPDLYKIVENSIGRNEKFNNFYKYNIVMQSGNSVNLNNFVGAYVTFNEVKKMSSVFDIGEESTKLNVSKHDGVVKIKIGENTNNTFCVLQTKTYFNIGRILTIVGICLLLLLLIIIAIIIYKKIRAKQAESKQKL